MQLIRYLELWKNITSECPTIFYQRKRKYSRLSYKGTNEWKLFAWARFDPIDHTMMKFIESVERMKSESMRRPLSMISIQTKPKCLRVLLVMSDECHWIQINTNLLGWIFDQYFSHVEVNTPIFDEFLVAWHYPLDCSDFSDIMYDDKCVGNPHERPLYLVVYPIELNTTCWMFCCFGMKIWCSSWIRVSNFNKQVAKKDVWTSNTEHFSLTC